MARKSKKNTHPQVSNELNGFDIQINEFGEINSSFKVSDINQFLDKKVDDKKFRGIDVVKRNNDTQELEPIEGLDSEDEGESPEFEDRDQDEV